MNRIESAFSEKRRQRFRRKSLNCKKKLKRPRLPEYRLSNKNRKDLKLKGSSLKLKQKSKINRK